MDIRLTVKDIFKEIKKSIIKRFEKVDPVSIFLSSFLKTEQKTFESVEDIPDLCGNETEIILVIKDIQEIFHINFTEEEINSLKIVEDLYEAVKEKIEEKKNPL